jgi:hypothetical protein
VNAELSVMRDEGSLVVLVTVKAMREGPEGIDDATVVVPARTQ